MKRRALVVLFLIAAGPTAFARTPLDHRVRVSSEVISHRMLSQYPIPRYIIDASLCVASLKVVKAGLIWGGQGSGGMVTCKNGDSWSAPSFFHVDGVTFGIQVGVQFLESVLMVMTPFGKEVVSRPTVQLGADVSFAAGPVGGGQGTGVIPDAHMLTYSRSQGLYAGATVNGFVLSHNLVFNRKAYGEGVSPIEILEIPGPDAPPAVARFVETMRTYMPY